MAKRAEIEAALRRLAPRIPPHEFGAVADHGIDSPGLRQASAETAAWSAGGSSGACSRKSDPSPFAI
jgi:hypothetical protein